MNTYWLNRDGLNYGPYSIEQLVAMLEAGQAVSEDRLHATEGDSGWVSLSSVINPSAQVSEVASKSPTVVTTAVMTGSADIVAQAAPAQGVPLMSLGARPVSAPAVKGLHAVRAKKKRGPLLLIFLILIFLAVKGVQYGMKYNETVKREQRASVRQEIETNRGKPLSETEPKLLEKPWHGRGTYESLELGTNEMQLFEFYPFPEGCVAEITVRKGVCRYGLIRKTEFNPDEVVEVDEWPEIDGVIRVEVPKDCILAIGNVSSELMKGHVKHLEK